MLQAIRQHEAASQDSEIRTLLHHVLLAHRFWTRLIQGQPFVREDESKVPDSLDALVQRYRETYEDDTQWFAQAQEAEMERELNSPFFKDRMIPVHEGLLQVLLHSQGHRAQCAAKLRAAGGTPPMLDYVLWTKDRPAPVWN